MRIRYNIGVIKNFYFKRTKKGTDFNIKIAEIKKISPSILDKNEIFKITNQ